MLLTSIPTWVNHQLESRVREIRLHGSEGGGAVRSPYPYSNYKSLFGLLNTLFACRNNQPCLLFRHAIFLFVPPFRNGC